MKRSVKTLVCIITIFFIMMSVNVGGSDIVAEIEYDDVFEQLDKIADGNNRTKHMEDMMDSIIKLTAEPYKASVAERTILALTIHCEAGIEKFIGKVAVGTVIMNRVEAKYMGGRTITQQILIPNQFSCVGSDNWFSESATEEDYEAADLVLAGYRCFGKEVLYYANFKIATDRHFVSRMNVKHEIGRHSFGTM